MLPQSMELHRATGSISHGGTSSNNYLFVLGLVGSGSNAKSYILEYAPGAVKPMRAIPSFAESLAVDHAGNLYAAQFDAGKISVYAPGSRGLIRTIHSEGAAYIAFDANDDLYVANATPWTGCPPKPPAPGHVGVYAPGGTRLLRTITSGLKQPSALVVDGSGGVYVGSFKDRPTGGCPPGFKFLDGSVLEYAAGSSQPLQTITSGINPSQPPTFVMDTAGALYLTQSAPNSLSVYPPKTTAPARTIGLSGFPVGSTFDGHGNLYVMELTPSSSCSVDVYVPGAQRLLKTIATKLLDCSPPLIDDAGNLYTVAAAKDFYSSVYVLAPGSSDPSRVLKDKAFPGFAAIALGPQ